MRVIKTNVALIVRKPKLCCSECFNIYIPSPRKI